MNNRRVLVLGLGETGLSLLRWLSVQGAMLRVADSRPVPPNLTDVYHYVAQDQVFCGAFSDTLFDGIDLIAISPGVPLRDPVIARAVAKGIPVVGDIELFVQSLPAKNRPAILAITGANGKTTVTSLVTHLCLAAGKDAVSAGNISPAVLAVVLARGTQQPDVWVLELSSFQLETTTHLYANAATVLNISEDHLDRYAGSLDDYAAAKERILWGCGVKVLNRDDPRSIGMQNDATSVITFGLNPPPTAQDFGIVRDGDDIWLMQGTLRLLRARELQLTGLHNVANALAALALCRSIDLPMSVLLAALCTFKGLPHRVEYVQTVQEVAYYDDSKGTNVGATVAALEGLGCKVVLIAGGDGKGQDFSPLYRVVSRYARAVVLIGRDAAKIAQALQGCDVPICHATDMENAVQLASQHALSGDVVLLSPACASLDMYRNYAHRAAMFIEAVANLAKVCR